MAGDLGRFNRCALSRLAAHAGALYALVPMVSTGRGVEQGTRPSALRERG